MKRAASLVATFWLVAAGLVLPVSAPSTTGVSITSVSLGSLTDAVSSAAAGGDSATAQKTVAVPDGAQLVGFVWDGSPDAELHLRSHTNGVWSEWVDLQADGSEAPDSEGGHRHQTLGPVWVGAGTDSVDVTVDHGSLTNLRLDAVKVAPPQSTFGIQPAGASAPYPGIIPRSAWGAESWAYDNSDCASGPKTILPGPALGVVHHTVNTNTYSPSDSYSLMRGIQAFHIHSNGWCDIGYNFVVDRYGQIFEARAGGEDKGIVGGHTRGFNSVSFGVALLGDFSSSGVPQAMRDSLQALLTWKMSLHGIDANASVWVTSQCDTSFGDCRYPAGQTVLLPTIIGHRDVNLTACPGASAYPLTWEFRPAVAQNVLTNGPFNSLPGWTPQSGVPRVLTLDGLGGVHPAGAATATTAEGYWSVPIARGITGDADGGYVADGYGGVHQYGSAPGRTAGSYWPGWDIVRGITNGPVPNSGYVLDGWGGLHPFGGATGVGSNSYWPGQDVARDVVELANGTGGYVLDDWGGVHPYGLAGAASGASYWPGQDVARAIALNPGGPGGYTLDSWGGVHPFGGAPSVSITGYFPNSDTFRDLVMLPGGKGYSVDIYGVAWPIGGAPQVRTSLTWTGYPIARGIVASPS